MPIHSSDLIIELSSLDKQIARIRARQEQTEDKDFVIEQYIIPPLVQARNNLAHIINNRNEIEKTGKKCV